MALTEFFHLQRIVESGEAGNGVLFDKRQKQIRGRGSAEGWLLR